MAETLWMIISAIFITIGFALWMWVFDLKSDLTAERGMHKAYKHDCQVLTQELKELEELREQEKGYGSHIVEVVDTNQLYLYNGVYVKRIDNLRVEKMYSCEIQAEFKERYNA